MSKYIVSWGWMRESSAGFNDFAAALACYVEHAADDRQIIGEGYDCDCDEDGYYCVSTGLTEDEEEAVELADAVDPDADENEWNARNNAGMPTS